MARNEDRYAKPDAVIARYRRKQGCPAATPHSRRQPSWRRTRSEPAQGDFAPMSNWSAVPCDWRKIEIMLDARLRQISTSPASAFTGSRAKLGVFRLPQWTPPHRGVTCTPLHRCVRLWVEVNKRITMPEEIANLSGSRPTRPAAAAIALRPISLLALSTTFFRIGASTFGGMWAATQKLENELVHHKRWLTLEEQQTLMVGATLIPAPKFLAFGGMVGFRLGGWPGSIVSLCSLIAPAALFVTMGAIFLNPDVLGAPMVPVRRAVGIAIIGLLFGNAYHQLNSANLKSRKKAAGILLAILVATAAISGVPLIVAAVAGFALGTIFIRKDAEGPE